jgi:hypothetical protein
MATTRNSQRLEERQNGTNTPKLEAVNRMVENDSDSDASTVPSGARVTYLFYDGPPGALTEVRRMSELKLRQGHKQHVARPAIAGEPPPAPPLMPGQLSLRTPKLVNHPWSAGQATTATAPRHDGVRRDLTFQPLSPPQAFVHESATTTLAQGGMLLTAQRRTHRARPQRRRIGAACAASSR